MAAEMAPLIRHLAVSVRHDGEFTDGQLLRRFIEHRDEAAVTAIVRRHGSMVWGLCRGILGNHHDAEDAFQATFLILVRKAGSIRQKEVVGGWLYGVAQQTAMKARAIAARRRQREMPVTTVIEPQAPEQPLRSDVQAIVHEELSRLPDKYRTAIVMCDLCGRTRKEAARQLRIPEGTVAGRLTRGRAILARRLTRRGVALASAAVAGLLSRQFAGAHVPPALMSSTLKGLALTSTSGVGISITVAALTEGVLKAMFLTKLKTVVGACIIALFVLTSPLAFRTSASDAKLVTPKDGLADAPPFKQEPPLAVVSKDLAPPAPPTPELPPHGPGVSLDLPTPTPAPTLWKSGVRATDVWESHTPEKAFDGDLESRWNSFDYAPGWIEKDLGAPSQLISIALHVAQTPDGATIHEIWLSDEPIGHDRAKAKLVHTFKGDTKNQQVLKFEFPRNTSARYLQVLTTESPSWVGWWDVEIALRAK